MSKWSNIKIVHLLNAPIFISRLKYNRVLMQHDARIHVLYL